MKFYAKFWQGGGTDPTEGVSIESGTWEHIVFDPADATCTMDFRSDGQVLLSAGVSPSTAANWKTGATGANYDISFDGGGSWNNLSTNRTISQTKTVGIGTNSNTYDVRIRNASTLATLATAAITLMATVDG